MTEWAKRAAEEIFKRLPDIEAMAGEAAYRSQSLEAEQKMFVKTVAEIIERRFDEQCETEGKQWEKGWRESALKAEGYGGKSCPAT